MQRTRQSRILDITNMATLLALLLLLTAATHARPGHHESPPACERAPTRVTGGHACRSVTDGYFLFRYSTPGQAMYLTNITDYSTNALRGALCIVRPLEDPVTGAVMGDATGCFFLDALPESVGDPFDTAATVFLNLCDKCAQGTAVSQVQHGFRGSPLIANYYGYDTATNFLYLNSRNSVIQSAGTGMLRGMQGDWTMRCAIDFSQFGDMIIAFDCIFEYKFR